jgi:hypothetical protein
MKQLSLIAFLCLACCPAVADFQLTDPAAGYEQKTLTIDAGAPGDFAVEGAGVRTCGDYLADSKKQGAQHFINLNWAKGFVTGVNYVRMEEQHGSRLGTGLDLEALTLYIDNYCNGHANATLSDASVALVNELMN